MAAGSVTATDKTKLLAGVPLFRDVSKKHLKAIARLVEVIDVGPHKVLTHQGDPGREMFVVIDGTVRVSRNNRKVAELGAGAVVGELSLIDGGERTATVTTTTEAMLLVIPGRAFKGIVESEPKLGLVLLTNLAQRLREADRTIYG